MEKLEQTPMSDNIFPVSEVMLMIDIMKEDKVRCLSSCKDKDVIDAYDSIISKLQNRLDEYYGMRRAINSLFKAVER